MTNVFRKVAVSTILCMSMAQASTITASLFSPLPPSGSSPIIIDLTGILTPSQTTLTGLGYSVVFAGVGANQGVVNGTTAAAHAVPVAGVSGASPTYLTGNFGSAQTTNIAASANYLSTGLGTITINFTAPQSSFALLWGSIDTGNSLQFNDAGSYLVTGTAVQLAAAGFAGNGFQGPRGSAWVVINTDTPFTTVTAASSVTSFEFEAVAASTAPFTSLPEPTTIALMGIGMLFVTGFGLRRKKTTVS